MNQVFYHAAFGKMLSNNKDNSNFDAGDGGGGGGDQQKSKSVYSVFTKAELEEKTVSFYYFALFILIDCCFSFFSTLTRNEHQTPTWNL